MSGALLALLLAGPAADDAAAGWRALRSGDLASARAAFSAVLRADADRVDAIGGLGFVALREGDLGEAGRNFRRALGLRPVDRDALVGLALVEEREGRPEEARRRIAAVLGRHPDDEEALAARERLEGASALARESRPDPVRPAEPRLPMRVSGRVFEIRGRDGAYRPIFLKAIDLGAALPGRFPSEFPSDQALYLRWFALMKECGFDAVRVYTILPPVFYDALLAFNRGRDEPLRLIQGVWVELPEGHDFSNPEFIESYRAEIRRVVDLVHGALDLPARPGHAGGRYRSDVSEYWIATILGREWEPFAVVAYDRSRPGTSDFAGRYVVVRGATASERWQAEQTDYAIAYEDERWNAQRPTAWTNWPTLDPLRHETESTSVEEAAWARKLGVEERKPTAEDYDDDAAALDMEKFEAGPANKGGLFASYHVYPYYPDFMAREYLDTRDAEGPNPFLGYLNALAAHHRRHPVFIAEFGVPTSRDPAHVHPRGWTHGGLGEREQGEIDAHMLRAIHKSGASGGALFEWIDEWFKHTWITRPYHRPAERNPLWHDRQDPEQHFGLIAQKPGAPGPVVTIDGKDGEWDGEVLLRNPGAGAIRTLSVRHDESDLYLLLKVEPGTKKAFAVAIDTVDPALGDVRFPAELDLRTRGIGFEAALLFDGERAAVVVDDSYDKFSSGFGSRAEQRPRAETDGDYRYPRLVPNRMRISRSGKIHPRVEHDASRLRRGTTDRSDPAFDDLAEWQYDAATGTAEFRIPWGLLNVTDPSSHAVLFESPDHPGGFRKTDGFRFAAAAFVPQRGEDPIEALDADEFEAVPPRGPDGLVGDLPLYTWPTWEQPKSHSFPKLSFDIYKEALRTVPATPATR